MHRSMSQQRDISDRRRPLVDYRAELKSPYCRPTANQYDQDKRMRREIANSNERRRMQSINNGFTILRKKLPNQHGEEKLSKANILQQTSDYINKLEDDVKLLTAQLKQIAYRSGDSQSSRKRKNLDRNDVLITGGLRDEDLCSSLIDEKLQMQYRLEEETEKTKKLMRRVAELEKVAASAKALLAQNAAAQQAAQQQPASQLPSTDSPKKSALVMSVPPISKIGSATASPLTATPASIVRHRRRADSPEPPAKQRAMSCHGLQQLILAADHLENERHQTVRAVARRDGKATAVVPLKSSDPAVLTASAKHLQFVQLVSAASQAEGGASTTTAISTTAGATGAAATATSSSSGSQIIQLVPSSSEASSTTPSHVLHLVTGQSRPRIQTVASVPESGDSSGSGGGGGGGSSSGGGTGSSAAASSTPAASAAAPAGQQQLLRIVPQVRLQGAKAESSVLGVPEIGQQFTLYMRRPSGSAALQQLTATAPVLSSVTGATTTVTTPATVTTAASSSAATSSTVAPASAVSAAPDPPAPDTSASESPAPDTSAPEPSAAASAPGATSATSTASPVSSPASQGAAAGETSS